MRSRWLHLALLAGLLAAVLPQAVALPMEDEPLPKLKERAEQARGGRRAELYSEAARREMEVADQNFTSGDAAKAHELVKTALSDAEKAANAAMESQQRLKRTEIDLRKLRHRTEQIRRTLSVDDRPQLEAAEKRMDDLLQEMLKHVFAK